MYNPNDDIYNQASKERNEYVVNIWRQELDAFVLTSKFNLYGIRVQQNKFKFEKVCTFMEGAEDITNIDKYTDCWYDTKHKLLFLIFRNIKNRSVQFKMYESDRSKYSNLNMNSMTPGSIDYNKNESEDKNATVVWDKYSDSKSGISDISSSIASSININIPSKLQNVLNNNYFSCNKSTLLYHKHLADKIATKSEDDYSKVVNFIRCKVACIVLRSALLCLRGSRTIRKEKIVTVAEDIDLGHDELLL